MWETLFGVGAVILLGALIYGVVQSRQRKAVNEPITEAATKESYESPQAYAERREGELRSKAK